MYRLKSRNISALAGNQSKILRQNLSLPEKIAYTSPIVMRFVATQKRGKMNMSGGRNG
jgi:uncharacterized Fe-S radical SAM superfamily protein PflX